MCQNKPEKQPDDEIIQAMSPEVVQTLVTNHRRFLVFLERRVNSRAVAEEILQNAFVKTIEKGAHLKEDESAVAWFFRLLKNALIDHYRHQGVERRALDKQALEALESEEMDSEIENAICGCMKDLFPALKPEYAEMLNKVDLEEQSIADVAKAQGISTNNATVRLHRARQALKRVLEKSCGTCAEHGCLDCSCSE